MTRPLLRCAAALSTVAALSSAGAQEKPKMDMPKHDMSMMHHSAWKEMDAFHALLAATYHPAADKKDLKPLRAKSDSLAAAARAWAASTAPSCATEAVKSAVATISTDVLAIGNQVLANASDADLTKAIGAVHAKFESVEKACGGMMDMKGMKH